MTLKRIIVKLGTSVLTNGTRNLSRQRMLEIVQQIAALHHNGHEVIVVSSGAQAAGREALDNPNLGKTVPAKQMLSAVGQSRLMQIYGSLFDIFEITVGQVLLTRGDLGDRHRYLNARDTLLTLIEHRIVPIVNENDATATDEIRVGRQRQPIRAGRQPARRRNPGPADGPTRPVHRRPTYPHRC
jgi:glutamate 5-kinase